MASRIVATTTHSLPAGYGGCWSQSSESYGAVARVSVSNLRPSRCTGASYNVKWASSVAFGNLKKVSAKQFGVTSSASANAKRGRLSVTTAFTKEQSSLVKESWEALKKDNAGKHALKFFLKIFEIAPSVQRLFPFLRDSSVPVEKNPQLKAHALTVLKLTGDSAVQLGEKGGLDALIPTLRELGTTHFTYGILDEHFDVVKFALLNTLKEAFPEKWTPELKEAWAVAYDEVVLVIKTELHAARDNKQAEEHAVAV